MVEPHLQELNFIGLAPLDDVGSLAEDVLDLLSLTHDESNSPLSVFVAARESVADRALELTIVSLLIKLSIDDDHLLMDACRGGDLLFGEQKKVAMSNLLGSNLFMVLEKKSENAMENAIVLVENLDPRSGSEGMMHMTDDERSA